MKPVSLMRLRKLRSPSDLLESYSTENLVVQPKFDGHLALVTTDAKGKIHIYSRRGNDVTSRLPSIVRALDDVLPPDSALLGEVVYITPEGNMDLSGLQSIMKSKGNPKPEAGEVRFFAFDLLKLDGEPYERYPYRERLMRTGVFVRRAGHPVYEAGAYTFDELDDVISESLAMGGEGAVIKAADAEYRLRPLGATEAFGEQWKYKPPEKDQKADVILTDYSKGKAKRIFTAKQYRDGELIEVGKLSGLDRETDDEAASRIDAGEHLVAEVTYQERLKSGKMRHMGWSRLRDDKPPKSVTFEENEMARPKKKATKKTASQAKSKAKANPKSKSKSKSKKSPRKNAEKSAGKRIGKGVKKASKRIGKAAKSDVGRAAIGAGVGGLALGPVGAAAGAGLAVATADNPTGIAAYEEKPSKSDVADDCVPQILQAFRVDMGLAIANTDFDSKSAVDDLLSKEYWLDDWLEEQVSTCLSLSGLTFDTDYSKYADAVTRAAKKQLRPMLTKKSVMAMAKKMRANPEENPSNENARMFIITYIGDERRDAMRGYGDADISLGDMRHFWRHEVGGEGKDFDEAMSYLQANGYVTEDLRLSSIGARQYMRYDNERPNPGRRGNPIEYRDEDTVAMTDPDTRYEVLLSRLPERKRRIQGEVRITDMDDPRRFIQTYVSDFDEALEEGLSLTNNPRKGMMSRTRPGRLDYMTHRGDMDYHRDGHDVVPRPDMNPSNMYRQGFIDRMNARANPRQNNPDYEEYSALRDMAGMHEMQADRGLAAIAAKLDELDAVSGEPDPAVIDSLKRWMQVVDIHLKAAMEANSELGRWSVAERVPTDAEEEYLRIQTKMKRARARFNERMSGV